MQSFDLNNNIAKLLLYGEKIFFFHLHLEWGVVQCVDGECEQFGSGKAHDLQLHTKLWPTTLHTTCFLLVIFYVV